eukprot:TRINITY_DN3907_c0_g1_i1.p1 TRINITY_DN3907_c0_g1~~TRINITY_DN3907_c0_g1_i1.p1  ORF type:complete len:3214 (-),score=676.59 TRINITY_DN3907_c0_g1_i1:917-10525(-)
MDTDILLNVFCLEDKPLCETDSSYSAYLDLFIDFLRSDFVSLIDVTYKNSVLKSLELLKGYQSVLAQTSVSDLINSTKNFVGKISSENGLFFVAHFPRHSCDLLIFAHPTSEEHLLVLPMELAITSFSTVCEEFVGGSDVKSARNILLPRKILSVRKADFLNDEFLELMADLQVNKFPGAFPFGTGRAADMPDERKVPKPIYVFQWLLGLLDPQPFELKLDLQMWKKASHHKRQADQGNPWRRSVHWASIRFVLSVVERKLQLQDSSYKKLQILFLCWLASSTAKSPDQRNSSKIMEMLRKIFRRSQKLLSNAKCDKILEFVNEKCSQIRNAIDTWETNGISSISFPDVLDLSDMLGSREFQFSPAINQLKAGPTVNLASVAENIQSIRSPIEAISLFDENPIAALQLVIAALSEAAALARRQKPFDAQFTRHWLLHGTERFVFSLITTSFNSGNFPTNEAIAEELVSLLHIYSTLFDAYGRDSSEQNSRASLLSWSCLMLVDHLTRSCAKYSNLMKSRGFQLPVKDVIQHLMLRDQHHMDVANILLSYAQQFPGAALFDPSDSCRSLFYFAISFFDEGGVEGIKMRKVLLDVRTQERNNAEKQQAEMRKIDEELFSLRRESCCCNPRYTSCNRCRWIYNLENDTHPILVHPLPKDDSHAKISIFFANMPPLLAAYGDMSVLASTLFAEVADCPNALTDCLEWSKCNGFTAVSNSPRLFTLSSTRKPLATNSHFKYSANFVLHEFYPDFSYVVAPRSGLFSLFFWIAPNTELGAIKHSSAPFRENLSGDLREFDWLIDSAHTENEVLASQSETPASMTPTEFVTFGFVRAAPSLQLRRLAFALKKRELSLSDPNLLTLARTVLFELGPADIQNRWWSWKFDMKDPIWVSSTEQVPLAAIFWEALNDIVNEIEQNWQSHPTMLLVVTCAQFLRQFAHRFDLVLQKCREVMESWIRDVIELCEQVVTNPTALKEFRLLLVQFYSYGLLASEKVSEQTFTWRSKLRDLKQLCHDSLPPLKSLLTAVDDHIFRWEAEIFGFLDHSPQILTDLLRTAIPALPAQNLSWLRNRSEYKANSGGDSFSIFPLDGLILQNKMTISELPSAIAKDPLFVRIMGSSNFAVRKIDDYSYSTTSPIGGCLYIFGFSSSGNLYVAEMQQGKKLILLDHHKYFSQTTLPSDLKTEYSHWIDFDEQKVYFRPIDFQDRTSPSFVAALNLEVQALVSINQSPDAFLIPFRSNSALEALTKFDEPENIHLIVRGDILQIKFAKYRGLSFHVQYDQKRLVKPNQIFSEKFPGYCLSQVQTIQTLPHFKKYLVLEPSDVGSTKLSMVLFSPRKTGVSPVSCSLNQQPKCLVAPSIASRLWLAYLYASTSTLVPDPLTQLTGYETALNLLRQCWQNAPYSSDEWDLLTDIESVKTKSQPNSALFLLVYYLKKSSLGVEFLHLNSPANQKIVPIPKERKKSYFKSKVNHEVELLLPQEEVELFGEPLLRTSRINRGANFFDGCEQIFLSSSCQPQIDAIATFEQTVVQQTLESLRPSELKVKPTASLFYFLLDQIRQISKFKARAILTFLSHHYVSVKKSPTELALLHLLWAYVIDFPGQIPPRELASQKRLRCQIEDITIAQSHVHSIIRETTSCERFIFGNLDPTDLDPKDSFWTRFKSKYLDEEGRPNDKPFDPSDFADVWLSAQWNRISRRWDDVSWSKDSALRKLRDIYEEKAICWSLRRHLLYLQDWFETVEMPTYLFPKDIIGAPPARLPYSGFRWSELPAAKVLPNVINDERTGIDWVEKRLFRLRQQGLREGNNTETRQSLEKQKADLEENKLSLIAARKYKELDALDEKIAAVKSRIDLLPTTPEEIFPLKLQLESTSDQSIGEQMQRDWETSFKKYLTDGADDTQIDPVKDHVQYQSLLDEIISAKRNTREAAVKILWSEVPENFDAWLLRLGRNCGFLNFPHEKILLVALRSSNSDAVKIFKRSNPCVSERHLQHLKNLIFEFALLTNYESKIQKLLEILGDWSRSKDSKEGFEKQLFTELENVRQWKFEEYPLWLLFEVENQLSIRPVQFEVARKLMDAKGTVLQLNMGEGKSRVIIPVLSAFFADGERLARINVLASQVGEVQNYLHRVLGDLLGKRVFVFPFQRLVKLTKKKLLKLRSELQRCRTQGGIILTTPEHRLSLLLKWTETLWDRPKILARTDLNLEPKDFKGAIDIPFVEILDESDELMHHRYQLIYTLGSQRPIDGKTSRWSAIQSVVRCIFMAQATFFNGKTNHFGRWSSPEGLTALAQVQKLLSENPKNCVYHPAKDIHVFPDSVRLLPLSDEFFENLRSHLWKALKYDPLWDKHFARLPQSTLDLFKRYVLNDFKEHSEGSTEFNDAQNQIFGDHKDIASILLTLRGMLSFDVLKNSLGKRHNINYGLNKKKPNKMAIPFRAKDTPAENVEFGHPDVAILLTILSYAHVGLRQDQIEQAFARLEELGKHERNAIYDSWYLLSEPVMTDRDRDLLKNLVAVNTKHSQQMRRLVEYYGKNFEVVNFFLSSFVFPSETKQFPFKIVANAWDIASGQKVVGFSGTDDTKYTLPSNIKQDTLPELESTNGKMIYTLTSQKFKNSEFISLEPGVTPKKILKKMCENADWNVLVDCGALIEGMTNREVVVEVMKLQPKYSAGIFYDEEGHIVIMERNGTVEALSNRPLAKDYFTYLDDIHTRGTDLPFSVSSHAIVTVGAGVTKDKLMQACMRMRKLALGQHTVSFWGSAEVTTQIMKQNPELKVADIKSVQVVEWVSQNSISSQEQSLIQYADQGFHHIIGRAAKDKFRSSTTFGRELASKAVIMKEVLELKSFYGKAIKSSRMPSLIERNGNELGQEILDRQIGREHNLWTEARPVYDDFVKRAARLAPDKVISVSGGISDEYERELEQEIEEQRLRELPPKVDARKEIAWDRLQILKLRGGALQAPCRLFPLEHLFEETKLNDFWLKAAQNLHRVNVYFTENFRNTVVSPGQLDSYLRPIDAVVLIGYEQIPTKFDYLLVSGFEAEMIDQTLRATPQKLIFLLHLSVLRATVSEERSFASVLLKLLNGVCNFSTSEEKTSLVNVLSCVPQDLPRMILEGTAHLPYLFPDNIFLENEKWESTWKALLDKQIIDKTGFVKSDQLDRLKNLEDLNDSCLHLVQKLFSERFFEKPPVNFVSDLLAVRGRSKDINSSDIQKIMGHVD